MGLSLLQVYILPTIRINGGQYRGKLAYAEVLRAICASYSDGTEKPPPCGKVADDSCRPGSPGVEDCKARCGSAASHAVRSLVKDAWLAR